MANLNEYFQKLFSVKAEDVKAAAKRIRAINHPLRQEIMVLIAKSKEANVTTIFKKLGLEQSVCSQHLAILRKAGFVKTRRESKEIYYSVNTNYFNDFLKAKSLLLEESAF